MASFTSRSHKPPENTPRTHSTDGWRLSRCAFPTMGGGGSVNLPTLTSIEPWIFGRPAQRQYPSSCMCQLKLWLFKIWELYRISRNRNSVVGKRIRLRDGRSAARFPVRHLRFCNMQAYGRGMKLTTLPPSAPVKNEYSCTSAPPVYLIYLI